MLCRKIKQGSDGDAVPEGESKLLLELQANWQKHLPQCLEQLQDDDLDPGMGVIYPEEKLPMYFLRGPDKFSEPPQEAPARPAQSPEEVEPP